jgi:NusA-like KH domain protein
MTGVSTKNCFLYNNFLIFAVPSSLISKAIGPGGRNVKRLAGIVNKKIKIVALPHNIEGAEKFISDVIAPVTFRNIEITEKEIIISASKQSKASLIGRNKVRLEELKKVIEEFFGKSLKIV